MLRTITSESLMFSSAPSKDPDEEYGEESEGMAGISKEDLAKMTDEELAEYKKMVAHAKWKAKLPTIKPLDISD